MALKLVTCFGGSIYAFPTSPGVAVRGLVGHSLRTNVCCAGVWLWYFSLMAMGKVWKRDMSKRFLSQQEWWWPVYVILRQPLHSKVTSPTFLRNVMFEAVDKGVFFRVFRGPLFEAVRGVYRSYGGMKGSVSLLDAFEEPTLLR